MNSPQEKATTSPMVAASSTLALVHYLDRQGVLDVPAVEQIAGFNRSELADPDLRIPAECHYRLWEHAER